MLFRVVQTSNNLIIVIIIIIILCCSYTEVTERNPTNCGDDGARGLTLSTYTCVLLAPLGYVNQPKAFVASEANEIRMSRSAVKLEGTTWQYNVGLLSVAAV